MAPRIVVAYASRYGSTQQVAEAAAEELSEAGMDATAAPAKDVKSLDGCDGVVLATPFYIGSMLKDANRFLERNQAALEGKPLALLACGPVNASDDMAEAKKQLDAALAKLPWLNPVAAEMFVGKYDAEQLRGVDKLVAVLPASPLHGVPTHDDRDWDAIRAWSRSLPEAMHLA